MIVATNLEFTSYQIGHVCVNILFELILLIFGILDKESIVLSGYVKILIGFNLYFLLDV